MDNFDLKKYLAEGRLLKEENETPIKPTDWADLDSDFSDSDEIRFRNMDTYFKVNIDQFQQDFNGFVVDTKGRKRAIDKKIFDDILESYLENWPDLDEGRLNEEESIPPRKFEIGDTVEFTPEAFKDYYKKNNMKGYIRDSPFNKDEEYIKKRYLKKRLTLDLRNGSK